jgi:hypothetical protein
MRGHFCETRGPEKVGDVLDRTVARVGEAVRIINAALAVLKECPAPCDDQTVEISAPGIKPRRVTCPIASEGCRYGAKVAALLDEYLSEVMSGIGVPPRLLGNLPGSLDSEAVREAGLWQRRSFLVLTGEPGVGKSHGAAVAVKRWLAANIGNWFDRRNWDSARTAAESAVWCGAKAITDDKGIAARVKSCRFAVIDDLGKEDEMKTSLAAIRDVISKRYDSKAPTVITTELTIRNIEDRYGRHIAERLVEDYCSRIADCRGESFRLKDGGGAA